MKKTACAIIIGNEILTGRTQDINLSYIGQKMMDAGIHLGHARTITDDEDDIIRNVNAVRPEYGYVFTCGGIGPTHDDITAQSIAKAFGVPLISHPEARARLVRHYGSESELTPARLRMTMVPEGATLIDNPVSGAPGFKMGNVHVMAGVPRIMQAMLDGIIPTLLGGPPIQARSIGCSLAESRIAEELGKFAARYPQLSVGSYPYFKPTGYGLSLVIRGQDETVLDMAEAELFVLLETMGGSPVRLLEKTRQTHDKEAQ
jgi:molybdopterin-biosynthesis enzyme MoeA-like protein